MLSWPGLWEASHFYNLGDPSHRTHRTPGRAAVAFRFLRCWPNKPKAQEIEDKVQAMCKPWSWTCRSLKTVYIWYPTVPWLWFTMMSYFPFKIWPEISATESQPGASIVTKDHVTGVNQWLGDTLETKKNWFTCFLCNKNGRDLPLVHQPRSRTRAPTPTFWWWTRQ